MYIRRLNDVNWAVKLQKESTLKEKNLGSKFLPFRVTPFQKAVEVLCRQTIRKSSKSPLPLHAKNSQKKTTMYIPTSPREIVFAPFCKEAGWGESKSKKKKKCFSENIYSFLSMYKLWKMIHIPATQTPFFFFFFFFFFFVGMISLRKRRQNLSAFRVSLWNVSIYLKIRIPLEEEFSSWLYYMARHCTESFIIILPLLQYH